jgi:hypothetical protein
MIDRASRDRLALALRRYVSGRIHNDALDNVEVDWRDRGAVAVQEAAWTLYNDHYQHYAVGRNAIPKQARREIARWIVFLHSDYEYLWPQYSFIRAGIPKWLQNLPAFRLLRRREERIWAEFCETGDISCWPFQNQGDLTEARLSPRLLAGHS